MKKKKTTRSLFLNTFEQSKELSGKTSNEYVISFDRRHLDICRNAMKSEWKLFTPIE